MEDKVKGAERIGAVRRRQSAPQEASPETETPAPPVISDSRCTCWLGTGATFGSSAERERCVVHGNQGAGVEAGDPLRALIAATQELQDSAFDYFVHSELRPHLGIEQTQRFLQARYAVHALLYAPVASPNIDCPLCGETVEQVSSATLSLALWQHVNWVCKRTGAPVASPPKAQEQP